MAIVERAPSVATRSADLRTLNMQRVLNVWLDHQEGPHTQATIARATDLAPATVNAIVKHLIQVGVLVEVDVDQRGQGLAVSPRAGYVVGVDVGNTHVTVSVADATGRPLADPVRKEDTLANNRSIVPGYLGDLVKKHTADLAGPGLAVCVGVPAPVGERQAPGPMLSGWEGSLQDTLGRVFNMPTLVENDANLGALAEYRLGAARSAKSSSIFVKASSGIGAGIIIQGQLWRGQFGSAGEIGHLAINEQGAMCRCGNRGCLEVEMAPDYGFVFPGVTAPSLETVRSSVALQRSVEAAGRRLGRGLALLATAFDPETIVIGGAWTRLDDWFIEPVRRGLAMNSMNPDRVPDVVASSFGATSVTHGATIAAADRAIRHLSIKHSAQTPEGAGPSVLPTPESSLEESQEPS